MHQNPSLNGAIINSQPNNSMPFLLSHPHNIFKTLTPWTIHCQEERVRKIGEGITWSPRAIGGSGDRFWQESWGWAHENFSSSPLLAENTQERETNPKHAQNHQELGIKVDVELKKVGWRGGRVRKRGDTRGEEQDGGMQAPLIACASRGTCNSRAALLGEFFCCF